MCIRDRALAASLIQRCADGVFDPAAVRDRQAFEAAIARRAEFSQRAQHSLNDLEAWLTRTAALRGRLKDLEKPFPDAVADARAQLDSLLAPEAITAIPETHWPRVGVYLQALEKRLERLANKPARDAQLLAEIVAARGAMPLSLTHPARWVEEEWRVALFAQELKAQGTPSAERLRTRLEGETTA